MTSRPPPTRDFSRGLSRSQWPRPPVDGLAGEAVSSVTAATGAVDAQLRLVAVGVQVTAAVVFGAEIRSCRVREESSLQFVYLATTVVVSDCKQKLSV